MRQIVILFCSLILCVSAWDDGDLEVFDAVEEVNQNFYELLGVTQEATPAEVKSAFKRLTLKLHPDKNDAPDADVQFRNLVSVHNVLKDPTKREKYNEVLKNGLPNWRSAVYYYRHLRKMGLAEASIIIFIITTLGQYAVSWAAYIEKRYTAEQILNTKKKTKKSGFDTGLAEILEQLPKPSMKDTLPFQIPKFICWLIMAVPRGIIELKDRSKRMKEEAKKQKKREEEDRLRELRESRATAERAAAGAAARKRRQFVPPERDCLLDPAPAQEDSGPTVVPVKPKSAPPPVSGGLWTDDDLAELVRLVKKYPGGAADRWTRIAEAMGRAVPEVVHVAATLKENGYRIQQEPEPVLEPPRKVKTRKAEDLSSSSSAANWSQAQQKALEAALARHPKGGAGDRWGKIAAAVPGKTKEECMARFRYLSELVKKQKQKEEEELHKSENGDANIEEHDN